MFFQWPLKKNLLHLIYNPIGNSLYFAHVRHCQLYYIIAVHVSDIFFRLLRKSSRMRKRCIKQQYKEKFHVGFMSVNFSFKYPVFLYHHLLCNIRPIVTTYLNEGVKKYQDTVKSLFSQARMTMTYFHKMRKAILFWTSRPI